MTKTRTLSSFEAYRSYGRLSQILLMTVIALIIGNIMLCSVFLVLFPLKEIQPMLLNVTDKANQVVKIEPIEKTIQGYDLLMEKLVRHYVQLRESFDLVTEEHRYKELAQFSTPELWDAFWMIMDPEKTDSPLKQRQEKHITRAVLIHACTSLAPDAPNTFQIEWESIDSQDGRETNRGNWISTLTVELQPASTSYADQYLNPIGFTVTHYSIREQNKEEPK